METINDIIKEMREVARNISAADQKTVSTFRPAASFAWFADRLDAAYKRDLQAMVTAGECDMRTAMDEVTRLREENEQLREVPRAAIPFSCLKCTFWNSRTWSCSRGSGMCTQVWKWKQILGEVAK